MSEVSEYRNLTNIYFLFVPSNLYNNDGNEELVKGVENWRYIPADYTIFELVEEDIPVSPAVRGACDLLGLDPFYCACEGRMLAVVSNNRAEKVLYAMRKYPEGEGTNIIGRVTRSRPGKLLLKTSLGGTRILAKLAGAQLPRIC